MIKENIKSILGELPPGVILVGAAKTRTPEEIIKALDAGLEIIGENYVQEAERAYSVIGGKAKWHMIGHLQSNKAKKAVEIFDMIETLDSMKIASAIEKACQNTGKIMEVLIEINSGEEVRKTGVLPRDAISMIREMAELKNIRIKGLMTMGPFSGDPENARPYFKKTREVFEKVRDMNITDVDMKYLSMGMSNSYKVAIEEGANMIRIGTGIFGDRI
ncbi:MAG: YggS family pyridoxal phosphate-dependent enzyme [Deltaproteobacteria bacterium]|nr:YggS family pyridoxal phosphate-dependent enzyme [Deltaproteobacteria bacterium]